MRRHGELGDGGTRGRDGYPDASGRRIKRHEQNLKITSSNIFLLEFELWDAWQE